MSSHCCVSNAAVIMIDTQHPTVAFWEEKEKGDHVNDSPVNSTADHCQRVEIVLSYCGQMVSMLKILVELIGIEPTTS